MGNSTNQTRDEIVRLRAEMTGKVIALRKATERPIRVAKMVAVGTAAAVVVGGVAIVVIGARHRAERKSLKKRMAAVGSAAANPAGTGRHAVRAVEKSIEETRERLRAELREELKKELRDQPSGRQKMLTAALRSAAGVAVPIIIKQLEQRMKESPNGKGASTPATPAGSARP